MADNDKQILFKAGFDKASFKEEVKSFVENLNAELNKAVKSIKIDTSLFDFKTTKASLKSQAEQYFSALGSALDAEASKVEIDGGKFSIGITKRGLSNLTKTFITELNDALNEAAKDIFLNVGGFGKPLVFQLDTSLAKIQIRELIDLANTFPKINLGAVSGGRTVAGGGTSTTATGGTRTTTVGNRLDESALTIFPSAPPNFNVVDFGIRKLQDLQQELRNLGLSEKDIQIETGKLNTSLNQNQNVVNDVRDKYAALNRTLKPGVPFPTMSDGDILRLEKANIATEHTIGQIDSFNTKQAVLNSNIRQGTGFLQSFSFQVGILGFSANIIGGQLRNFGLDLLRLVRDSGEATSALKTMRDIMEGNILTQEKFNQIRQTFRSTDQALEAAFGTNRIEILKEQGKTGIEIINGLVNNFSKQDKALFASAKGWDTFDQAVKNVGKTFSVLTGPAVLSMADRLNKELGPALDRLVDKFQALPKSQQNFLSGVIIGIPTALVALGALATAIGSLLVITAGLGQAFKVFGNIKASLAGTAEAGKELGAVTEIVVGSIAKVKELFTSIGAGVAGFIESIKGIIPGIIEFFTALASGTIVVSGLVTSLGTSVTGLVLGAARILGLTTPIGIAINLLLAYATNFGEFRDKVNSGIGDLIEGFKKLADGMTSISGGPVGKFLLGFFQTIGDILEQLASVAGSVIGAIFEGVGSLLGLIGDLLKILNAKSLTEAFTLLGDAIGTFFLKMLQRVLSIVLTIVEAFIKVVGNLMVRLGIVTEDTVNVIVAKLDDWKKGIGETNLAIKDGQVVLDEHAASVEKDTEAIKKNIDEIRNQQVALDDLTIAINKQKVALAKEIAAAGIAALKEQQQDLVDSIKSLASDFEQNIESVFDKNVIKKRLDEVLSEIATKRAQLANIRGQILQEEVGDKLTALTKEFDLKVSSFLSGVKDKDIQVQLGQAITDALNAKTKESAKERISILDALLEELKTRGIVTQTFINDIKVLEDSALAIIIKASADNGRENSKLNLEIDKTIKQLENFEGKRKTLLERQQATREQQLEDAKKDDQVANLEKQKADIDNQVANFELTASKARQQKEQIDEQLAEAKAKKQLNKISRDIAIIDPNDIVALQIKQDEIVEINKKVEEEKAAIHEKGLQADKIALDKAIELGVKRAKAAADASIAILKTFENVTTKVFAQTVIDGVAATNESFKELHIAIDNVAGDSKVLQQFNEDISLAHASGNIDQLTKALVDLKTKGLDIELQDAITKAQKQLQALIISAGNPDQEGNVAIASIPAGILRALGLDAHNISATKEEIKKAVQNLKIPELLNSVFESLVNVKDLNLKIDQPEEVEALRSLIVQILELQAKIQNQRKETTKETLAILDKQIEAILSQRIDAQLAIVEKQLAELDKGEAERGLAIDLDQKRKLLVSQIEFNFQKAFINSRFREEELLRDEKDTQRRIDIETQFENERVKLRLAAENQIRAITNQDTTLQNPTVPGTTDRTTRPRIVPPPLPDQSASVFATLNKNLGDTSKLDKFSDKILRLSDTFNKTFQGARNATSAMVDMFKSMASGQTILDTFQLMLDNNASSLDLLKATVLDVGAAFADAFASALKSALADGQNFLTAFTKALGTALINMGTSLVAIALAAEAMAFFQGLFHGGLFAAIAEAAAVLPQVAIGLVEGAALIALGGLLGGGAAGKAATTNTANTANANTGAQGTNFDPNADPRTVFQKALMTQVYIDIRHDDGIIVKKVIKEVNRNGRLANLIGNRTLEFGY